MPVTVNIAAAYGLVYATERAVHEIDEPFEYFEDFLGEPADVLVKVANPQRETLLHNFLSNYGDFVWDNSFHVIDPSDMIHELLRSLETAGIKPPKWFTEEKIDDNKEKLKPFLEKVLEIEVHASFQLLFQDKEFLYRFHLHVKEALKEPRFKTMGNIVRCQYIPTWLKRAVFFRDQGRCQSCGKDVSGLLTLENKIHLDHLLPLHQGGTNDSTNFQLLCEQCNRKKGGKSYNPKNRMIAYWTVEEGEH